MLLAEITKREKQSGNIISQVDSVQEQLRVALSTLQQAIGGVQFQVKRDKEQIITDVSRPKSLAEVPPVQLRFYTGAG